MTSGAEIYRSFQNGDVDRLQWALDAVNRLCQEFEAEVEELEAARDQMMAYWEGDSADAADKGVSPLVGAHVDGAPLIDEAGRSIAAQAESFSQAKARVVPVPDEPTEPSAFAKFAGTIAPGMGYGDEYKSYRDGMADHAAANANNVRVMAQYKASTDGIRSVLPSDFGIVDDDGAAVDVETRAASAVSSPTAGSNLGGAPAVAGGAAPIVGGGYPGGPATSPPGTATPLTGGTTSGVQQPSATPPGTPGTTTPTQRPVTGTPLAGSPLATPIDRDDDITRSSRGRGMTTAKHPAAASRAGARMTSGGMAKSDSAAGRIQRGADAAARYSGGGRGQGNDNDNDNEKDHKNKYAIKEALDAELATEADELGEKVADEQTGTTVVAPVVGDTENGGKG